MRRLLAMTVLVVSCGGSPAPVSDSTVVLAEGMITVTDLRLLAGRVSLEITNSGQYEHTLVVTTTGGQVVAATGLIAPGDTERMSMDLAPGGYQFSCRIVVSGSDGAVRDHYQLGMKADVRAVAP